MSTKAIREALQKLADSEPGASDGSEQARLVAAAFREVKAPGGPLATVYERALAGVEAIERAAKTYVKCEHALQDGSVQASCFVAMEKTMCAIAKDAP